MPPSLVEVAVCVAASAAFLKVSQAPALLDVEELTIPQQFAGREPSRGQGRRREGKQAAGLDVWWTWSGNIQESFGGPGRDRTDDLFHAMQAERRPELGAQAVSNRRIGQKTVYWTCF